MVGGNGLLLLPPNQDEPASISPIPNLVGCRPPENGESIKMKCAYSQSDCSWCGKAWNCEIYGAYKRLERKEQEWRRLQSPVR